MSFTKINFGAVGETVAKAFLISYSGVLAAYFIPYVNDPIAILDKISDLEFMTTVLNSSLGAGISAAVALTMKNPFNKTVTPEVVDLTVKVPPTVPPSQTSVS